MERARKYMAPEKYIGGTNEIGCDAWRHVGVLYFLFPREKGGKVCSAYVARSDGRERQMKFQVLRGKKEEF